MFNQLNALAAFRAPVLAPAPLARNDNYVRQMLAMLILFRFGAGDAGAV